MSDIKWVLVFSTAAQYQAEIVKQMLENNGLEAIVMNKQDSSYPMLGEADVLVSEEHEKKARKLIEEFES
ncbi:MAG TPA: DUF2007 domain-containing protein [Tenuifilaceae bacterium]|nr:DUF2007 domain-containing protein [Tenuifilaceae bacterium]HPE18602.1 DUF2007 domain-containing protein [Tenuifilaceae bacterium]HPJ46027.1 DUF2007 domain-containing protein [Tenuifilaceae bacterium]HPQ34730.1 DUF2007 domain-containing protein [Tenuifilaceae bacterium]HRX67359.1 DUF2007 domain-containing protein [Tenuifilaceae bacterium]